MTKMKELIGYHFGQFIKPLAISYTIFFLMTMGLTMVTIQEAPVGIDQGMLIQMDLWAANSISFILMGIVASLGHSKSLKNLTQNGFTRQEVYTSKLLAIIALSVTMSLLNLVLQVFQRIIFDLTLFSSIADNIKFHLILVLVYFFIGIIFTFFAIVVNKLGARKSIILYIIFFVGTRLFAFLVDVLLSPAQQDAVMSFVFWFIPRGELPATYLFVPFTIMTLAIVSLSYWILKKTDIQE